MIRSHAQHESMHVLHAKARARMLMLAQGCEYFRLLLTRVSGCDATHTWQSLEQQATPLHTRGEAVRVVAQPDRQGQLGKADGRRVVLVGGSGIGARDE